MTFSGEPTTTEQPCGCRTTSTPVLSPGSYNGPNPIVEYLPCLACALTQAGVMLQQAGLRMAEAAERQREDDDIAAERVRIQAEDFIGGND